MTKKTGNSTQPTGAKDQTTTVVEQTEQAQTGSENDTSVAEVKVDKPVVVTPDPAAGLSEIGKMVYAKHGDAALTTITKIASLVDTFAGTDFNTARSTNVQKEASYDALLGLYNEVLNTPAETIGAAIDYVVQYYTENRMSTFRPMRTMMLPITTRNVTQQTARFVSDMNQLISALSRTNNANGLRKIIRIDSLLNSLRSDKQRQVLNHYLSTIDL